MNKFLRALGDCAKGFLQVGTGDCEIKTLGDMTGFGLVRKGYKFTKEDLTAEGWKKLLKKNIVLPIRDIFNFEQNTPENETNTSPLGIMKLIRDGKPQFNFMIDKGLCAHKKLYDKKGIEWDLLLFFEKGMFLASDLDGEHAVGFDMSFYDVSTYKFQQGTDPEQTTVTVQFRDAHQFNMESYLVTWDKLGFNANRVNAPIQANLDVVAKAGTEIEVEVTQYCNSDMTVLGLEESDAWLVNGVKPTAVAFDTATSKYKLTVATMTVGQNVVVELDGNDGRNDYKATATVKVVSA